MDEVSSPRVTVLGIGNPIMGDDGIGLELLRQLQTVVAGGTDVAGFPGVSGGVVAGGVSVGADSSGVVAGVVATGGCALGAGADSSGGDARPIEFIDGGTSGMELLPVIQDADCLLLLDAVAGPGEPGTVVTLLGDQVPRLQSGKLSPHQVGLLDLLAAARLLGREPRQVAVVGIVPSDIDLRIGLSSSVAAALPPAVSAARSIMTTWLGEPI